MARVTVYIDGFNLYYGALKPRPALKWLDIGAYAAALRPTDNVSIRYFTARVKAKPDPAAQGRQKLYLAALDTVPNVSVHLGHFTVKPTFMPYAWPRPGGPKTVEVLKTEEKGSDVNLGTFLVLDGCDDLYDEAVVITDDSDLAEPLTQAATRFGPVHVVSPRAMVLGAFSAATTIRPVDPVMLASCQFPSPLTLLSGRAAYRPPGWS